MIADVRGSLINPQRTLVPLPLDSHALRIAPRADSSEPGALRVLQANPAFALSPIWWTTSGFDLADTEQIRPLAGMHRRDHRGKVVDLAIKQLWRPAGNIVLILESRGPARPASGQDQHCPRSGADHSAVTDDCVGRWPDDRWRRGAAPPRATNLGVRAGYVTESGDVSSHRMRNIKPYAVNGSARQSRADSVGVWA